MTYDEAMKLKPGDPIIAAGSIRDLLKYEKVFDMTFVRVATSEILGDERSQVIAKDEAGILPNNLDEVFHNRQEAWEFFNDKILNDEKIAKQAFDKTMEACEVKRRQIANAIFDSAREKIAAQSKTPSVVEN